MNQQLPRPVLVVEDDEDSSAGLCLALEKEGFRTLVARDGSQALELASRHPPVLVTLDLLIPKVSGWDVCRELRRTSAVPIIILSGRGEPHERIFGLGLGADDYVVKPFDVSELIARVRAVLRRAQPPASQPAVLSADCLSVDLAKRRVTVRGAVRALTSSEYQLLQALMRAPGRTFLREELLDQLYPDGEAVVDRVIDVHIGNLRRKIEDVPAAPRLILTTRGVGYRFADPEDRRPQSA